MKFDKPLPSRNSKTSNNDVEAGTVEETSEDGENETPSYNIVPHYSAAYRTLLIILLFCVVLFALILGYQHYNLL